MAKATEQARVASDEAEHDANDGLEQSGVLHDPEKDDSKSQQGRSGRDEAQAVGREGPDLGPEAARQPRGNGHERQCHEHRGDP